MIKELIPLAGPNILKAELEQVQSDLMLLDDRIFYQKQFSEEQSKLDALFDRRAILKEYERNLITELLTRYFKTL